ncbi:MAG TPA: DUF2891 family protein [Caulobacter sp.]|nr:DUF2891 family protein [Caulobacter sp.]
MSSRSETRLTADIAGRFARVALGHVTREYPHKADHVFNGPEDVARHRDHHPVFFGSFDWHSCVHGYWTLATVLRRFPDLPESEAIRVLFTEMLTTEKLAGELAYLSRPMSAGFERPYGWAWLLKLAAELRAHDDQTAHAALAPLAAAFSDRFKRFLPKATYPLRAGVHSNTAFALRLAMDYAEACGDLPCLPLYFVAPSATTRWPIWRGTPPSAGTSATGTARPGSRAATSSCRRP